MYYNQDLKLAFIINRRVSMLTEVLGAFDAPNHKMAQIILLKIQENTTTTHIQIVCLLWHNMLRSSGFANERFQPTCVMDTIPAFRPTNQANWRARRTYKRPWVHSLSKRVLLFSNLCVEYVGNAELPLTSHAFLSRPLCGAGRPCVFSFLFFSSLN